MRPNGRQNLGGEKSSFRPISRSTPKMWGLPLAEPTKHTNGLGKHIMVPLPPLRPPPTCTRRPLDCTIWPSNIATVIRQHIVTPPAATAKQRRKTAPTLSANDEKQKTSKATSRSDRPVWKPPATDDFAVRMQNAEFRVGLLRGDEPWAPELIWVVAGGLRVLARVRVEAARLPALGLTWMVSAGLSGADGVRCCALHTVLPGCATADRLPLAPLPGPPRRDAPTRPMRAVGCCFPPCAYPPANYPPSQRHTDHPAIATS